MGAWDFVENEWNEVFSERDYETDIERTEREWDQEDLDLL